MSSLLEKLRAAKAEREINKRPAHQQISVEDINLRGTGLTKREAEKNTRAYDREAKASLKADKTLFIAAEEQKFQSGIEQTIAEMRAAQLRGDIIFDNSQIAAIAGIKHNKVSVLIGAAGTGKTTVTKEISNQLAKLVKVVNLADVTFVYAKHNPNDKPERTLLRDAIKNRMIFDKPPIEKDDEMPGIAYAAYTGRATQQLKRALPKEWHSNCSTIHSLLGYAPVFEDVEVIDPITGEEGTKSIRRFRPTFDASMKLPYMIYVFDEASMVPIPLFNEVIDAIHETSRILLIGDIHQLPPVYGKSVLGYAMRKWPVFELTTIHRQAAGNAIISNAHNVLKGKSLENASNFHLIGDKGKSPAGSGALQKWMLQVIQKLADLNRYDPYKDTIIVPQNKDMVGQIELNQHLVTMFNPEIKENGVIINKRMNIHTGTNHVFFAIRDKVMITSNINTVDPPITNGMVGIVESIHLNSKYDMKRSQVDFGDTDDEIGEEAEPIDLDLDNLNFALSAKDDEKEKGKNDETDDQRQSSHVLTIKFENGQSYTCSTAGDYRRVTHGYAATCHKSQGGEYPNVIILCHSVNARMLSQEWLYTAITRARENVYILCNDRGLNQALGRQVIKGNTLKEKIASYIIETKSDDMLMEGEIASFDREKYPILWEPEKL